MNVEQLMIKEARGLSGLGAVPSLPGSGRSLVGKGLDYYRPKEEPYTPPQMSAGPGYLGRAIRGIQRPQRAVVNNVRNAIKPVAQSVNRAVDAKDRFVTQTKDDIRLAMLKAKQKYWF